MAQCPLRKTCELVLSPRYNEYRNYSGVAPSIGCIKDCEDTPECVAAECKEILRCFKGGEIAKERKEFNQEAGGDQTVDNFNAVQGE